MKPYGETSFLTSDQIDFQTVMDGVEVVSVVGHHAEGPHGTLIRLAPGVRLPLHHYTGALSGVVLGGRVAHPVPGNAASQEVLAQGAFFSFAPGESHETNNEGDGAALFFVFQDQAWDFQMD